MGVHVPCVCSFYKTPACVCDGCVSCVNAWERKGTALETMCVHAPPVAHPAYIHSHLWTSKPLGTARGVGPPQLTYPSSRPAPLPAMPGAPVTPFTPFL